MHDYGFCKKGGTHIKLVSQKHNHTMEGNDGFENGPVNIVVSALGGGDYGRLGRSRGGSQSTRKTSLGIFIFVC